LLTRTIPARRIGALLCCIAPAAGAADAGNAFNPKISLVLQGTFADYQHDRPLSFGGFMLDPDTETRPSGFSLGETELAIESNIDDLWHGWAAISIENNEKGDTSISVEEAYVNTLTLPEGLAFKMGRFFSDIGYQNRQHSHAWDFVEAPLVYQAFYGGQLDDDGVQLKWVAPTDIFLEFGAEATRGANYPSGGTHRSGVNGETAFVHLGGDLGIDYSYRLGASYLHGDSHDRESNDTADASDADNTYLFTGKSNIVGIDGVLKWAPQGNATQRNATLQGEVFRRHESGDVTLGDGSATTDYSGNAIGAYLQGVVQFMPRWRVGARYDWLSADNKVANNADGTFDLIADDGHDATRESLMLDYSRSEFSRLRLQFNHDDSRADGSTDNQILLQYIFSLGSHPAHVF
jgi:hypothetical protein